MSRFFVSLLLMLIFAACTSAGMPVASPIPTPEVWRVQYSMEIRWLLPVLHECILEQPGFGLSVTENLLPNEGEIEADFVFHWGEVNPRDFNAYLLWMDSISVVVNPTNAITAISIEELEMIFRGEITTWGELGANEFGDILAWIYPEGSPIQKLIYDYYLGFNENELNAWVAPDIETMKELVIDDPNAIGFLPDSWLDDSLKTIQITRPTRLQPSIPITLLTKSRLNEKQSEWISCIKGS